MTESQKLSIKASELRTKRDEITTRLNEIAGLDSDAVTPEIRAEADTKRIELDEVTGNLATAEVQFRAALAAEGVAEARAEVEFTAGDGEPAELRALRTRARVSEYVAAALEQRAAGGAEAELNEALHIRGNGFPLSLLAPAIEARATTDVDSQANQSGRWLDRLFAGTGADKIGITMESVAPGVASFPVTTAGASAAQRGRREAAADAAWTVGVTELKPSRNTVRAVFTEEDAYRLPTLESSLRRDLGMALVEGVDRAIFVGDAGANENRGDITGLQTAADVVEQTITQANKVKGPETLAAFSALVDGIHAMEFGDLRICSTVGAWRLWESTVINAAADNMTTAGFLRAAGLAWMARGEIEADTADGDFAAFIGRARGIEGAGVAAMWESGMLIRDPYTGAGKGEVGLTLSYYWNFGLPRATNFARVKFGA
ncbi:MAG: hypothetical protein OXU81_02370 [Gammaproteobacteria bacterium]|nr:hypothetical protein [Gammaproteobacteria bacterium]